MVTTALYHILGEGHILLLGGVLLFGVSGRLCIGQAWQCIYENELKCNLFLCIISTSTSTLFVKSYSAISMLGHSYR